jgi:hypothetical protein
MTTLSLRTQKKPWLSLFIFLFLAFGFITMLHQILTIHTTTYPKMIATKLDKPFSSALITQLRNQCNTPLRSRVLPTGQVVIQCGIMKTWLAEPGRL